MSRFIKIGKAAEFLGVSIQKLRRWKVTEIFFPDKKTKGMIRYYDQKLKVQKTDLIKAYARVSSQDQKEDLVGTIGMLRYSFAHATPFIRGSASIAEWLEEAIYKSHDLDFERVPQRSSDLEALTTSSPDYFIRRIYPHTIWISDPSNDGQR